MPIVAVDEEETRQADKERRYYLYLLATAVAALLVGTIFYHMVEHLGWINAYYFSVITLTTVGYGDITPHTDVEKIFTTFYIFVGVGILATFLSVSMNRRMNRRINRGQNRKAKHQDKQKRSSK